VTNTVFIVPGKGVSIGVTEPEAVAKGEAFMVAWAADDPTKLTEPTIEGLIDAYRMLVLAIRSVERAIRSADHSGAYPEGGRFSAGPPA